MLLPGLGDYCGKLEILDIGLSSKFITENPPQYFYLTFSDIEERFKKREKFSHKGTYGHALIVAGNAGKCGAAILSAKACIKSGAGLVTVATNNECITAIHASIAEVMIEQSNINILDLSLFSAIGIGPGMGFSSQQVSILKTILQKNNGSLIMDADALTILSKKLFR